MSSKTEETLLIPAGEELPHIDRKSPKTQKGLIAAVLVLLMMAVSFKAGQVLEFSLTDANQVLEFSLVGESSENHLLVVPKHDHLKVP